ncbi:MAG: hypothetical protein EAX95_14335 [Candidatus Thorarchaeota archaeon]|nr:hypothetical protein [Candidatus Thorarchaeota archaeon]
MRRAVQTRLTDFEEAKSKPQVKRDSKKKQSAPNSQRPRSSLWEKEIERKDDWGVCNFDGTVLFVQLVDGKIHAHGMEATCKWCQGTLEIHGEKVFCTGTCKRYQGMFSIDLNDYLRWDGAKSYTLRKSIAEKEGLVLEERDLTQLAHTPNWSILEEYEEDDEYSQEL